MLQDHNRDIRSVGHQGQRLNTWQSERAYSSIELWALPLFNIVHLWKAQSQILKSLLQQQFFFEVFMPRGISECHSLIDEVHWRLWATDNFFRMSLWPKNSHVFGLDFRKSGFIVSKWRHCVTRKSWRSWTPGRWGILYTMSLSYSFNSCQFCPPLFGSLWFVPGFVEVDSIISWLKVDFLSHDRILWHAPIEREEKPGTKSISNYKGHIASTRPSRHCVITIFVKPEHVADSPSRAGISIPYLRLQWRRRVW